jgi:hypothetical protein
MNDAAEIEERKSRHPGQVAVVGSSLEEQVIFQKTSNGNPAISGRWRTALEEVLQNFQWAPTRRARLSVSGAAH